MASLDGKVVLITGAGSGLGRSHAEVLAARGAALVLNDVGADGLAATADAVRTAGGTVARSFVRDVSDVAGLRADIAAAEAACGRIDVLVNNAGVGGYRLAMEDVTEDIFDRAMAVHVKGTFFAAQAVVPGMKARRAGRIVNTSSMFAMGGADFASQYAAAKSAISGLTHSWARELAPWNITVNAVAPGFVETPMTAEGLKREGLETRLESVPLGRLVRPLDISHAVAFLASDDAAMVTGQILSPNGGERIVGY